MGGEMVSLRSATDLEVFAALMAGGEIESLFFASDAYNQTLLDCQAGCPASEHSVKGIGFDTLVDLTKYFFLTLSKLYQAFPIEYDADYGNVTQMMCLRRQQASQVIDTHIVSQNGTIIGRSLGVKVI